VAEEMEAFLAGRPIKARPVGPAGRLLRWCRRQPALAALSAALVIALAGGIVGMAMGWGEARRKAADEYVARHAAEAGETRASLGVYNADMMLANVAALDSDRARLNDLLDRHDPALHPGARDYRSWEWFFLKQQTAGDELFILGSHKSQINAVAVAPDGRWAASSDPLGMLVIWDLEKRSQVAESRIGGSTGAQLTFSPDGQWLAAAWESGQSSLWRTGRWQAPAHKWQRSASGSLVFSEDSRLLYQASRDNLRCYPMPLNDMPPAPDEVVFTMPPSWWVLPVYEPGSHRILVFDGEIRFWDGETQSFSGDSWKLKEEDGYATMLKPETNRKRMAGWFNDDSVYVFDTKSLKALHRLKGHKGAVFDADFSPDGTLLATGGADQSVQIWNLESGERIRRLSGHRDAVAAVAFFPDGTQVLSGSRDGTLRAWSAKPPPPPEGHLKRTGNAASLSSDGRFLLEVQKNEEMAIRSVPSGNAIALVDSTAIKDSALGPGGQLLALLREDGFIELRDLDGTDYIARERIDAGATDRGDNISLSADGTVLVLTRDASAVVYETTPFRERLRFPWPAERGPVKSVAFSPDSKQLALAHGSSWISVRDLATGSESAFLEGDDGFHPGLAFSPGGQLLACASFHGGARAWDLTVSPPRLLLTTTAHGVSWSVAFTPDSRRLVVGLDSGDLAFWDLETGALVMQFRSQGIPALRISFDAQDHTLITLTANRVIRRGIAPGFMIRGRK
jgi:WD40 repeat protein